jgi:HlyD family secretion protein
MTRTRRIVVAVVVAAVAIGFWVMSARDRDRDGLVGASGTVEATEAQIGFQAAGRIQDLAVREGETVTVGEELAHLDRSEAEARQQQAIAQAGAARALLEELERGSRKEEIRQGRAALAAAAERLRDAERDLERTQTLFEGGAVSREALDKARVTFDVAKSQYDQAQEQVTILETGPRREKIEAQRAQVAQAEAAVRVLDATLANMILRAPFDGIVTVRHREPGEIVAAGSPVLTVMNPADRWVRIYVPETRIGAVRLGQAAEITSDTYPTKIYLGEVVFISSQAEFTPKTVQTTEERVKLVYAVKVRITEDPTSDLKPGMPADVRLDLGPGHA